MRGRAFHPVGFVSSYLRISHSFEVPHSFSRCIGTLLKHVLPTLLMLIYGGAIALYLGALIEQTKQGHRQSRLVEIYAQEQVVDAQ